MASWTDAISTFNPYVSTLPVDAMVKVGMQKQAQYEEGVQKIQSNIDQVAGMDVLKDIDKNYLQTKLNDLGKNLRTVAAGDFSDFQLVNSVGGMAKQISRDKNVQNAVSSTAWYRKQQKAIEDARKEGKSNVANEDLFNTQVSGWLGDNKVGSSFSSEYIPYTDVFKKLQEIAKSVGEDSTIVQQLFQTDANGNPVYKDGKLQYNDVMAETLLKGKDKNKILNAFQSGLDANDYRQLGITGRYELKGRSKEDLGKSLEDGFLDYQKNSLLQKDSIQDKILELKTKGGAQKDIDALQEVVLKIDDNIAKRRSSVDQMKSADPDAIRGSIYTNNFLDSLSNSFSTKETYTKYSKNPGVEVMMDREKMKLDQNKFKFEQDKFRYDQLRDIEEDKLAIWKAKFEKGLVDENGNPTGAGLYSGVARDIGVSDQTNSTYFTEQFQKGLEDDMSVQFKLYEKVAIADWMAKNSGKINPKTGKPFSSNEIRDAIVYHAGKTGHTYNDYIVLQGQKATDKWNQTKGKSLGAEYSDDFKSINQLGNRIGITKKKMDIETEQIKAKAAELGFTPFDLSKAKVGTMSLFGTNSGKKLDLSEADVIDAARWVYHNRTDPNVPRIFDSKIVSDEAKAAEIKLKKKFGEAGFRDIINTYHPGTGVASIWQTQQIGGKRNLLTGETVGTPISNAIGLLKDDNYKKTIALREDYYKGISEVGVPKGVILYKDKPEQKEHLQASLASVVSDYATIDKSYEEIAKYAVDDKSQFQINIDPATSRYGNNSYSLQVTTPEGSLVTKPITEKHYQFLTGKEAPSLFIDEVSSSIKASPYGSTNLSYAYTDDDAYSTAFVKDYETRTDSYNVAIDYVMGRGGYFPKIYVQIDNDWKLFPYNPEIPLTAQNAKNFPSMVDDLFIKSLMQRKK